MQINTPETVSTRRQLQQPAQPQQEINDRRYQCGIAQFGAAWIAIPDNKTLMIQRLTGEELYVDLGSGRHSRFWSARMAEMTSGFGGRNVLV